MNNAAFEDGFCRYAAPISGMSQNYQKAYHQGRANYVILKKHHCQEDECPFSILANRINCALKKHQAVYVWLKAGRISNRTKDIEVEGGALVGVYQGRIDKKALRGDVVYTFLDLKGCLK